MPPNPMGRVAWVHAKSSTRSTLMMALRQEWSSRSKDLRSEDWKHGVVLSKYSTLGMAMEWRRRVMASCLKSGPALLPWSSRPVSCWQGRCQWRLSGQWTIPGWQPVQGRLCTGWGQHPGSSCQLALYRSVLSVLAAVQMKAQVYSASHSMNWRSCRTSPSGPPKVPSSS